MKQTSHEMMFQVAYGLGIEPYALIRDIQEDNVVFPRIIGKMDVKE
jgi:hypothetical protein